MFYLLATFLDKRDFGFKRFKGEVVNNFTKHKHLTLVTNVIEFN